MSLDLLNELEKRVQSAVSTIEVLKAEIEQLKEENAELSAEKDVWGDRLSELLGKFDLIGSVDDAVDFSEEAAPEFSNESEDDSELSAEVGSGLDDEAGSDLESLDNSEGLNVSYSLDDDLGDLGFAEDDAEGGAEETLANQAFEQDFTEETKDDLEDNTFKSSSY